MCLFHFIKLYLLINVAVKKIEHSLLRMYLVNAIINSKQDKVLEFFEKMGPELQNQQEWKDWFGTYNYKTLVGNI